MSQTEDLHKCIQYYLRNVKTQGPVVCMIKYILLIEALHACLQSRHEQALL